MFPKCKQPDPDSNQCCKKSWETDPYRPVHNVLIYYFKGIILFDRRKSGPYQFCCITDDKNNGHF